MGQVDLSSLSVEDWPSVEDETWEFKSSKLSQAKLKEELPRYVSAFANSGGGCLLWGVADDDGNPDGGVERNVGSQPVADWLDKAICQQVQPPPEYKIREFTSTQGRGVIEDDKAVVAIAVATGRQAPFQYVKKGAYYFRAGRHTEPAPHSLVEAMWSRRLVDRPLLGFASMVSNDFDTLILCNVNKTPSFDVVVEGKVVEYVRSTEVENAKPEAKASEPIHGSANFLSPPAFLSLYRTYHLMHPPIYYFDLTATYRDLAGSEYTQSYQGTLGDLVRMPQSIAASVAQQDRALHAAVQELHSMPAYLS